MDIIAIIIIFIFLFALIGALFKVKRSTDISLESSALELLKEQHRIERMDISIDDKRDLLLAHKRKIGSFIEFAELQEARFQNEEQKNLT